MLLWDLLGKFPGTDYESFNYEWVIGKLKELKDSVAAALASEEAAAESAGRAAGSMGLALMYQNKAKDYRDEAQGFADDAQDSAESIADIAGQVATNTGRIDSLIATAGDGTIPSELTDVRVAFNGFTFPTAGNASRAQAYQYDFDAKDNVYHLPWGNFIRARMVDGETSQTGYRWNYRVASPESMVFPYDIYFNVESGFRYSVHYMDANDEFISETGWRTDTIRVPANQRFRMIIAVNPEGSEVQIDDTMVPVYVSKVYYMGALSNSAHIAEFQKRTLNNSEKNLMHGWTWYNDSGTLIQSPAATASSTQEPLYLCKYSTIGVDAGYEFKYYVYDENGHLIEGGNDWLQAGGRRAAQLSHTGFVYISIQKSNADELADVITNHLYIETLRKFPEIPYAYTSKGGKLNLEGQNYNVDKLLLKSTSIANVPNAQSYQGFAVYNNVVFQLYNDDILELTNMDTSASINIIPINSDHGDTIDFTNIFYEENDEFPLACISADTNPAKVYINRISRTGATLIDTLIFPLEDTGYYAGHVLDNLNHVMYQVGYKNNSYSDATSNNLIVSKWNLDDLTDNGNGTHTPEFMESFEIPFYTTLQGQAFKNGLIYAVSSNYEMPDTKVIVIDVAAKRITAILEEFPAAIKNTECEGIAFVNDNAIIKPNNRDYWLMTFEK